MATDKKIELLTNWILDMLPLHDYVTVAIFDPPPNEIMPVVRILTSGSSDRKRAEIEANPLTIAGVFVSPISREDIQDAIKARYEEIENAYH